jgi:hypothetical protein
LRSSVSILYEWRHWASNYIQNTAGNKTANYRIATELMHKLHDRLWHKVTKTDVSQAGQWANSKMVLWSALLPLTAAKRLVVLLYSM